MTTNPTIAAYDQYAQIYDQEVIDFWDNFPTDFVEQYVQHLPGTRILNVGSGSGRDALLLRSHGLQVVCLDGSKSMVALTAELGFESHHADFLDMDFPAASFDGIWAYTSLIHIPKEEAQAVLQKLRTLLAPNGILAVGVIEGTTAEMKERSTMPGAKRYFKNYTNEELSSMVEALGFRLTHSSAYRPHHSVYLNHLYTLDPS